jgi:RHS repeat-associated protein
MQAARDRPGSDTYGSDGNTINSFGTANTYDFENHMVTDGYVTLVYDGDGNRVAETAGGVTTNYLVDTQNPTGYAQVVDELQSGTVARTYSFGLERIRETQTLNSVLTTSFYGYDGHGSVRQLTNSTGAVTDTYDYDAFGNLINSTGSTPNNYLFAGEQYDPALGLYYNRARYLNTTTGRFWDLDSFEGQPNDPLSLHKYLYAGGDPVNRFDPSGNQIDDLVGSFGLDATLNAVSTVGLPGGPGGPAWQILAHAFIPGWVWNSLASSLTPDAVDVGFSFTGTQTFGGVPITGGPGLETLYGAKTGNSATYLSAGLLLNFGGVPAGTTLAGTAGLVYNLPSASQYAGPFISFSVPLSLLPQGTLTAIAASVTVAYGALAERRDSAAAAIAFTAAAFGLGLIASSSNPNNLTANVFWGSSTNTWGLTLSLGPPSDTGVLQFGVTADILLTGDVPFE